MIFYVYYYCLRYVETTQNSVEVGTVQMSINSVLSMLRVSKPGFDNWFGRFSSGAICPGVVEKLSMR